MSPTRPATEALGLRPLAARSVVLSLLLGVHPPELPVRQIVQAAETFGVAETTLRVALTRMVSSGDLTRDRSGVYRLSDRLVDRQLRQDASIYPAVKAWRGDWEMLVITAVGRSAADRADLRSTFAALRLAELREGVWMRPANLRRPLPVELGSLVTRFKARPDEEPSALAAQLWNLSSWAATGEALIDHFRTDDPRQQFMAAAAVVRHLLTDPVLPPELLPSGWPGDRLREAYASYQAELLARSFDGT